jgi:hypothetical protein
VAPTYPTFGLRLADTEAVPQIRNVIDVLSGIISTMRYAHDRFFLQAKELGRVINIDLTGVATTATSFTLSDADKDTLYARGYVGAKNFLLNTWSWTKHLAARGFAPDGAPLAASRSEG